MGLSLLECVRGRRRRLGAALIAVACVLAAGGRAVLSGEAGLPPGEGRAIVYESCGSCHAISLVQNSAGISRAMWEAVLFEMDALGMEITPENREIVLDYLATYLGPNPPPTEADADSKPKAADLYAIHCSSCHGKSGQGVSAAFPPLAGNPYVSDSRYNALVILYGLKGEVRLDGRTFDSVMPSFSFLEDAEVVSLAHYIATAWGTREESTDGRLESEDVKPLREKRLSMEQVLRRRADRAGKD